MQACQLTGFTTLCITWLRLGSYEELEMIAEDLCLSYIYVLHQCQRRSSEKHLAVDHNVTKRQSVIANKQI